MARPVSLSVELDDCLCGSLTVQNPEISFVVEFKARHKFVFFVDFVENFDGRVFVVIVCGELAVFKLVESISGADEQAVFIKWVHIDASDSWKGQSSGL